MNKTETTMLRDVLTRAAHTAWQAGAATAATLWVASGMHVADLAHASGWAHLWTSVAVGAGGAALSAAKTSVLGYAAKHRAQLEKDLIAQVTADLTGAKPLVTLTADTEAFKAALPAGPTLIDDAHPVLADPDRAAADTVEGAAPEPPSA